MPSAYYRPPEKRNAASDTEPNAVRTPLTIGLLCPGGRAALMTTAEAEALVKSLQEALARATAETPNAPTLTVTLKDACGTVVETRSGLCVPDAHAFAASFMTLHGTDPDGENEGRSTAAPGIIEFQPESC